MSEQHISEYRAVRGRCDKNAACGRQCALSSEKSHKWHVCQEPGCWCKQCPPEAVRWTAGEAEVRARVDGMDVWTLALALVGLVGIWLGGVL